MAVSLPKYGLTVPSETSRFRDLGKELREMGLSIEDILESFDYTGADPNLVLSRVSALEGQTATLQSQQRYFTGTPAERAALTPAPAGATWCDIDTEARMWRAISGEWVQMNAQGNTSLSNNVPNATLSNPGTIPPVAGLYSGGAGQFTPTRSGIYDIIWTAAFGAATTGRTFLAVNSYRVSVAPGEDRATLSLAGLPLDSGTAVSLHLFQTSGAPRNVTSTFIVTRR